jgi:hypothetical protein
MQQITVLIDLQDQSGIFLHTKHILPRCRPPDRQPTTTTGHHTTCCNLQSYAPEDGQMSVRNMLSWSWRSINTLICRIQLVLILLHCLMLIFCRWRNAKHSLTYPLLHFQYNKIVNTCTEIPTILVASHSSHRHSFSWSIDTCHGPR